MFETKTGEALTFDRLARAWAEARNDFFFIQVGANDGRIGDPLFHLVTEYGWRGVLVEPQPDVYEKHLIPNYAGYENLSFENVAIDRENGQRELYELSFSRERWATGLASFQRAHLERHIANGYIDRMVENNKDSLPADTSEYISSETVVTMTFGALLDKYHVEHLDLLQIDTEGYDYTLLRLFDFSRLKPEIIQLEHHVMTDEQRKQSLELLERNGYLTFFEHINMVGFRKELAGELGILRSVKENR